MQIVLKSGVGPDASLSENGGGTKESGANEVARLATARVADYNSGEAG